MSWLLINMNEGIQIQNPIDLQMPHKLLSRFFASHRNLRLRFVAIKTGYHVCANIFGNNGISNKNARAGK